MSILIKAERGGSAPRVFYFRESFVHFGEDSNGLLSWKELKTPLFSMYSLGEAYWLQSEDSRLQHSGKAVLRGSQFKITEVETLVHGDLTIDLITTSGAAEVLARAEGVSIDTLLAVPALEAFPKISFTILQASRTYPLFPDFKYSLGKDPKNTIQIDLSGISAFHCSLYYQQGVIQVKALGGEVKVNESEETNLRENGIITLAPLNFPLTIAFP